MAQIEETRSYGIFLEAIKTKSTESSYVYYLNKWLERQKCTNHDQLLKPTSEQIQRELEDYLLSIKGYKSRHQIDLIFYSLFLFYSMNNKIINETKLKKLFPEANPSKRKPYTTEHIKMMLKAIDISKQRKNKNWSWRKPRAKAIIFFLASSGARLGSLSELKVNHLTKIDNLYKVKIYGDSKYEYITFITPEATVYLDEYLAVMENLKEDDYVFNLSSNAIQKIIRRLIIKSEAVPTFKNVNGRSFLNIPVLHGFRSRFNTICKLADNANPTVIESLMGHGHKIALDKNYFLANDEQLLNEYKKHIPALTIF